MVGQKVTAIPKRMRAVVYRGPNDLRLEEVEVPRIQSDELLVKVAVCGVCPTDIKKIQYGTVPPPRIFGHETAGTIVKLGSRVRRFREGDRVALHHHVPCLECHFCRHGAFAQCDQYKRTGITAGFEPAGGGYAEYVRVMPFVLRGVVKIPARNSFQEGAMLEPVNTVLKAVNRLALLRGDTVLVAGQGPIGLMFTRLLALRGVQVVATDLLETRLRLARAFGAKAVFSPQSTPERVRGSVHSPQSPDDSPKSKAQRPKSGGESQRSAIQGPESGGQGRGRGDDDGDDEEGKPGLAEVVERVTGGRGLDTAVIAVPSDAVMAEAMSLVRGGGQVLLFSHTRRGAQTALDLATVCVDEKDVIGSYSADVRLQTEVARLVFSRRLDVRRLITHQFPLEETAAAVGLASQPTAASLKVVVSPEQEGQR
jgi:L-iditol 2-dehydrogenase